jgi:hypothetical protein
VQVFHRHAIVLKDFPGIGTVKGLGQTFGDAAKAPTASLASIARLQFVRIRDVQEEQFNELLRIARHIFVGSWSGARRALRRKALSGCRNLRPKIGRKGSLIFPPDASKAAPQSK